MSRFVAVTNLMKTHYRELCLCLVAISIPLTIKIGNAALILSLITAFFVLFKQRGGHKNFRNYALVFPLVFFFWILVSGLAGSDIPAGLKQIDKALLYPIIAVSIFILNIRNHKFLRTLLLVFANVTLATTLIFIISGGIAVISGKPWNTLYFHEFGSLFDQHPVYIGLYASLSVFIFTHYFFANGNKEINRILLYITSVIILLVGINFTASKAVIVMFLILFLIQLMINFKTIVFRAVVLLMVICSSAIIFSSDYTYGRFSEGLHFDLGPFEPTEKLEEARVFSNREKELISDLELRYLFLKIGTYHTINDNKTYFGYGVGDVQHHMDYYYMTYGLAPGWFEGYNLHNQFLQLFASMGIFLVLFFLSYLVYSFRHAFKNRNVIHVLFLILITFVFFFECVLSRNKGIIFFMFFNSLFLINGKINEVSNSGN